MKKRKSVRTALPKRLRFDVFKRDKFTCQYCGMKAPDVVLEIDHIVAVAAGGGNDILNLRTACKACNAGKSDKPLSTNATIEARRKTLEDFEERRQQLEMMHEWHLSLIDIDHQEVSMAGELWFRCVGKPGSQLNEEASAYLRKVIKKYGFDETCNALRIAADPGETGNKAPTEMFWKVDRIIVTRQRCKEDPDLKRLYYIRGIVRKRCDDMNERHCMAVMGEARKAGVPVCWLETSAKQATTWDEFEDLVQEGIDAAQTLKARKAK
jgi:hypothetical protein